MGGAWQQGHGVPLAACSSQGRGGGGSARVSSSWRCSRPATVCKALNDRGHGGLRFLIVATALIMYEVFFLSSTQNPIHNRESLSKERGIGCAALLKTIHNLRCSHTGQQGK